MTTREWKGSHLTIDFDTGLFRWRDGDVMKGEQVVLTVDSAAPGVTRTVSECDEDVLSGGTFIDWDTGAWRSST